MGANAQTSVPAFTAGQVLTAAQMTQVNTGIPVFASSTERDDAFGGAGEKTLAEGQYAFLEDVNETQVYDGAAWNTIGGGGLVFISRTTIGSAVSSVTVSGAFSADYDSYKIIVQGGAASTNVNLQLTLGATTAGYYHAAIFNSYTTSAGGSTGTNTAFWIVGGGSTTTLSLNMDIHGPYATEYTTFDSAWARSDAIGIDAGYLNNTTSYTAFTIATNTGTMTGGTIDVYGYAKA